MVKELIAKYSRLNDTYNALIKESIELQRQLEKTEDDLRFTLNLVGAEGEVERFMELRDNYKVSNSDTKEE